MLRTIILLAFIATLTGCGTTPEPRVVYEYVTKPVIHPTLPRPVDAFKPSWEVVTKETIETKEDNVVYQALEWDQGQEYRIWLEDVARYIRSMNATLCSYREELNEKICEPYKETIDVEPESE